MTSQTSLDASIQTEHATANQESGRKRKGPGSLTKARNIALSKGEQRKGVQGDVLSVERKDTMQSSASQKINSQLSSSKLCNKQNLMMMTIVGQPIQSEQYSTVEIQIIVLKKQLVAALKKKKNRF